MTKSLVARILSPLPERGKWRYYNPGFIEWNSSGKITKVGSIDDAPSEAKDLRPYLIMPGLVDMHVHPGQYGLRGYWANDLLTWLNKYILPGECDADNVLKFAEDFWEREIQLGVTSVAALGPTQDDILQEHLRLATKSNLRVIMGPTLMDIGVSKDLSTPADLIKTRLYHLRNEWESDFLKIAVVPRYPLSCSLKLMKIAGELASEEGFPVLTHLAESLAEVEAVAREFISIGSYTNVLNHCNLLGPRSAVAHCLHLNNEDIKVLKLTNSVVVHCPSANMFLRSGTMPYGKMALSGVSIGLGSDVGAGPSSDMFDVMRDMCYQLTTSPTIALWHCIFDGREQLWPRTGRLQPGYFADFAIWKTPEDLELDDVISKMVFLPEARKLLVVKVGGRRVWGDLKI